MSLASAPLRPLPCIDLDGPTQCPAGRDPFAASCLRNFDSRRARCGTCLSDSSFDLDTESCEPCGENPELLVYALVFLYLLAHLGFGLYMYMRFNRPNPEGAVLFGILLTFAQSVSVIGQVPVSWPARLRDLFNVLAFSMISSLGGAGLQMHTGCLTGNGYLRELGRDLLAPATMPGMFVVLFLGSRIVKRPLEKEKILNVCGKVFGTFFVSINTTTASFFTKVKLGNDYEMTRALPSVEFGSAEWSQCLPYSVLAFCVYSVGFYVYVLQAVQRAPRKVAADPTFVTQYRFCIGNFHPSKYWWLLVSLLFSAVINLVQALASDVFAQLYLLTLATFAVLAYQSFHLPFKFRWCNAADLVVRCTMLFFCIAATACIDLTDLAAADVAVHRSLFGDICLFTFAVGMSFIAAVFLRWLYQTYVLGEGHGFAQRLHCLHELRDTALVVAGLSNQDFNRKAKLMPQADLAHLAAAQQLLVENFLGMQSSGPGFRLIPGKPFCPWDAQAFAERTAAAFRSGELTETLHQNWTDRTLLQRCAESYRRQRASKDSKSRSLDVAATSIANLGLLGGSAEEEIDLAQWLEAGPSDMTKAELQRVFELVDIDGGGSISNFEFIAVTDGMAPPEGSERAHDAPATASPSPDQAGGGAGLFKLRDDAKPRLPEPDPTALGQAEGREVRQEPDLTALGQLLGAALERALTPDREGREAEEETRSL